MKTLGKVAIYKEHEYEFRQKSDGRYALYSNDSKSLEDGFMKISETEERYMKIVKLEELACVFQKETDVIYKGDTFIGSLIEGDKVMLYTRNAPLGQKYNMIMRDKDEYYLYVELKEVDSIIQKWIPCNEYEEWDVTAIKII